MRRRRVDYLRLKGIMPRGSSSSMFRSLADHRIVLGQFRHANLTENHLYQSVLRSLPSAQASLDDAPAFVPPMGRLSYPADDFRLILIVWYSCSNWSRYDSPCFRACKGGLSTYTITGVCTSTSSSNSTSNLLNILLVERHWKWRREIYYWHIMPSLNSWWREAKPNWYECTLSCSTGDTVVLHLW